MPFPTLPFRPSSSLSELFRPLNEWPAGMAERCDALEHELMAEEDRQNDLPNPGRLERYFQHHATCLTQLETLLTEWPVPTVRPTLLSAQDEEKLLEEGFIVDPANLRQTASALDRRWGEQNGWDSPGFMAVPSADGPLLKAGLGQPISTFHNYDGEFGMWWFQMDDHPIFSPQALFNVCGGPQHMGFRAGVLSSHGSHLLNNHNDRVTLRSLVLTWWVASVEHHVCPERPWVLHLPPWTIERNPA